MRDLVIYRNEKRARTPTYPTTLTTSFCTRIGAYIRLSNLANSFFYREKNPDQRGQLNTTSYLFQTTHLPIF